MGDLFRSYADETPRTATRFNWLLSPPDNARSLSQCAYGVLRLATKNPTPKKTLAVQSQRTAAGAQKSAPQHKKVQSKPVVAQKAQKSVQVVKQVKAKQPTLKANLRSRGIPSAPYSGGLKMPHGGSQTQIHDRLKKKSPWYTSIKDPLHGADCKIPDETGVETGTLQIVQRFTTTANAEGVAGAKLITPYVNSVALGDPNGSNIQIITPGSNAIAMEWGDLAGNPGKATAFDGVADIKAISKQHRIVSCCLIAQSEAALATNSGEICGWVTDFADTAAPLYDTYLNLYKTAVLPVNSNSALTVRWFPVTRQDWSFKSFLDTDRKTFDTDDSDDEAIPTWNLGVCCKGMTPGTVVRITAVVNYEFIPTYNTLNVLDVSPSPNDVTEVDLVESWVQEMPISAPISQKTAASSPATVAPQHGEEPTGFGMFADVVMEIIPFALALL